MSNVFQYLATRLSWDKVDPSIVVILNYSRPTLNLLEVCEEFCHQSLQENKGADQLAHAQSDQRLCYSQIE